jgi:hypothetical protein
MSAELSSSGRIKPKPRSSLKYRTVPNHLVTSFQFCVCGYSNYAGRILRPILFGSPPRTPARGSLAVRAFEDGYNLLMLLPSSNELLVSAIEPRILVYGGPNQVLVSVTGAEGKIS